MTLSIYLIGALFIARAAAADCITITNVQIANRNGYFHNTLTDLISL